VIDESKKIITIYRKEREMKKKIAAAVVLIMCMCMWSLSGCHTVKGVGQDVESLGGAIEDSSGK
jgi:predicted small secreted protein